MDSPGPRYAVVTLVTSDSYLAGALVALSSLLDAEGAPASPTAREFATVCLATPQTVGHATLQALDKAFDFPAMTRIAVGSKWSSFTPEQQAAVIDAFKRSLTVTYANRLARAAGGKFDVTPKVEERGAQRVVPTRVTAADGDDSAVDFVVNADNRIQDVLLNGDVSEIAAQRNALSAPLKSGGADGVVKFLRARTDGMLAAKPTP